MMKRRLLAVMPEVTLLLVRVKELDLDFGRVEDGPRDLPEVKCTRRRQ